MPRSVSPLALALSALLLSAGCGGGAAPSQDGAVGCGSGITLCGAECVDTDHDPAHCGACGNACAAGQVCSAGACGLTCGGGTTDCSGACVDTDHDPAHCGACDNACATGEVCSAGTCGVACLGGTTMCGSSCVDTDNDPAHCGACDDACAAGEVCSAGTCGVTCLGGTTMCGSSCVDTDNDPAHCGACDDPCASGEYCDGGTCITACPAPLTVCTGMCTNTSHDPANCGSCGNACSSGEACLGGTCRALAITCDDFSAPNGTTVPGWTERTGDFFIDAGRLYTTASGGAYSNHITMDGTVQADGCATMTASYGTGAGVRSLGIVLRWTATNSYIVAVIQDNSSSGTFDSMWIYEYNPGITHLAGTSGFALGTNPIVRASVTGTTVLLEVDVDRNGTYDETMTATTTVTAPGLTGAMGLGFAGPAYIDAFCPACM